MEKSGLVFYPPESLVTARDARIVGAVANTKYFLDAMPEMGSVIAIPFDIGAEIDTDSQAITLRNVLNETFESLKIPRSADMISGRRLDRIMVSDDRRDYYFEHNILKSYLKNGNIFGNKHPQTVRRWVREGRYGDYFTSQNSAALDGVLGELIVQSASVMGLEIKFPYRANAGTGSRSIDLNLPEPVVSETYAASVLVGQRFVKRDLYNQRNSRLSFDMEFRHGLPISEEIRNAITQERTVAWQDANRESEEHYDTLKSGDEVVDLVWLEGGYTPDYSKARRMIKEIDLIDDKEWRGRLS